MNEFKWWPAAIRQVIDRNSRTCHFFDRATMKFFGQTMRDFKVTQIRGRVFLHAPGKFNTITVREFLPDEERLVSLPFVTHGMNIPDAITKAMTMDHGESG